MNSFEELGLSTPISQAVSQLGFDEPTQVQREVIPLLTSKDTDVVVLAQTGTGKTAAFGLPLVQKTFPALNRPQALILSPTRELCIQITRDLKDFSRNQQEISTLAVYGGSSINKQIKALNRGVQIIAATPGRLLDLMRRGKVDTSAIQTVVLDEADQLLNMGFQNDLNAILDHLDTSFNTWLFSATMPSSVEHIARRYMNEPIQVTVGTKNAGTENVTHKYIRVPGRDRYEALTRIIDVNPEMYGIVFCRTKRDTEKVAQRLSGDGYKADFINGDLSQSQRDRVMKKFRSKQVRLMIATDVASRGIDVEELTHVINYQLPDDTESYTHRSGRTGRAGKLGISLAITTNSEKNKLRQIEKSIKQKFEHMEIPNGADIRRVQASEWVERLKETDTGGKHIESLLPDVMDELSDMSREELIKNVMAKELRKPAKQGQDIGGRKRKGSSAETGRSKKKSNGHSNLPETGYERFFVNLGKKHNLKPGHLIGMINDHARSNGIDIGKIDLMGSFSFFEAEAQYTREIVTGFKRGAKYRGFDVTVEVAKPA